MSAFSYFFSYFIFSSVFFFARYTIFSEQLTIFIFPVERLHRLSVSLRVCVCVLCTFFFYYAISKISINPLALPLSLLLSVTLSRMRIDIIHEQSVYSAILTKLSGDDDDENTGGDDDDDDVDKFFSTSAK